MEPTQEQIKKDAIVWIEGVTHYTHETEHAWPAYYKVCGNSIDWKRADITDSWSVWMLDLPPNAIPRPTKPAFVPEVGVECEYSVLKGVYKTGEVLKVTKPDIFNVYAIMDSKTNQLHWATDVRPIKSEREKFQESVKAKIPNADTDDIIFAGKLFDAGFIKEPTK